MKKAILISIKPEYVAEILNHRKTIEIRKTAPKCGLPIDVYVYCTKGDYIGHLSNRYVGKVVAKFTLRKVEAINTGDGPGFLLFHTDSTGVEELRENCRISPSAMDRYLNGGRGYAWFIEDLVVFDQPKELDGFDYPCPSGTRYIGQRSINGLPGKKRPPESWCYVEEKEK